MGTDDSECSRAACRLGNLFALIAVDDQWKEVESAAEILANALRTRGGPVDEHTALGRTLFPQTLTSLLKAALEGPPVPDAIHAPAVLQLLRVGANLCMDHDENRGHLLEAGFMQTALSILEGYIEPVPASPPSQPWPLSLMDLKIVKTAVGVVLNISLGFEPAQSRLISLDAPATLLKLASSIYPPTSWLNIVADTSLEPALESWTLRSTLSEWSWRAISALKDNVNRQPLFGPTAVPFLISPIRAFTPPHPDAKGLLMADEESRNILIAADIEVLSEACEVWEAITLDVEDVRLALGKGACSPLDTQQTPYLVSILDFIEHGSHPPYWSQEPAEDQEQWQKTFAFAKAAMIKAIVEVAGDDKVADTLWDIGDAPKIGFVDRMVKWLRTHNDLSTAQARDDLIICSTLSLGNLVRKDGYATAMLQPPLAIAPDLVSLLDSDLDVKVKHGVIGLLRNLSTPPANRPILGQAGVIAKLSAAQIFAAKGDVAEIVQISGINLTKHLCTNNVENSIAITLPTGDDSSLSVLSTILALVKRSDSIVVKSEGTRVLVNVIKSLCSTAGNSKYPGRQTAIRAVTSATNAKLLARLFGRSGKFPVLINESTMALFLLAHQRDGAPIVLGALVASLPTEVAPAATSGPPLITTNDSAPTNSGPATACEMIATVLKNTDQRFPPEIRLNICLLLAEIGKNGNKNGDRGDELQKLKKAVSADLEAALDFTDNLSLNKAIRTAMDSFA